MDDHRHSRFDPDRRRLLRCGLTGTAALGLSTLLAPSTGRAGVAGRRLGKPRGVHVSFSEDPATTRTVTWFTDSLIDPGSHLRYVVAGEPPREIRGEATKLPGVMGLVHRATMRGLPPGRAVRYQVGSPAGGWSPMIELRPWHADSLSFTHFGDHGTKNTSIANTLGVLERRPDLHLLAGDLSYANGDQAVWDTWFRQIEPLAARLPLMTAPGNHENEDFPWGSRAYRHRLTQPGEGSFYAFDLGRVHFLVLSAGAFFATDRDTLAEELLFAARDLAEAAERRADGELDFLVVLQHFTIWTDQAGRAPNDPALVALEEPLLVRHGVDLVMAGHDHFYQRSHPMAFGQQDPAGYVQVTNGCGGQSLRGYERPPQPWSAFILDPPRYCFTEYRLQGRTLIGRTFATDGPGDSEEVDTFRIEARSPAARGAAVRPAASLAELRDDVYKRRLRRA